MSDTIAIESRFSPQTIKTIDGATIDVFAALVWTALKLASNLPIELPIEKS